VSQTWVFVILGTIALLSLGASIAIWLYLWRTRRREEPERGDAS
jgi:hypothetical protein